MFFTDTFMKAIKPRYDDDSVDRLNYYYTPVILLLLALTLTAKNYVGQPLQCWVPAQFTGAWEQYTENFCFVQNTYFLPLTDYIPRSYKERDDRELGYYQWVPFVLALQALLFFLPAMFWRLMNWQSGIQVKSIIGMAIDTGNVESDKREKNVGIVAAHVADSLELQRELKAKGRFLGFLFYGKHWGAYVTALYLITKVLFVVNVIGQFFILNSFLGFPHSRFWGYEVLNDLAHGREWQESGHFPRVTMCDFDVRVLGNLHRHTVQCVLMINMFNEKIYLFLWWWFLLVAIVTCLNLLAWIVDVLAPRERSFIMRYLRVSEQLKSSDSKAVDRFIHQWLRPDGVLLMRLISINAGDILTTDLVHSLWILYGERRPAPPLPPNVTGEKQPLMKPGYGNDETDPGFRESLYPPERRTPPQNL